MINGNVDLLSCNCAQGWACDNKDFTKKLTVTILYNGEKIIQTVANKERFDLKKINDRCDFSFSVDFNAVDNVNDLSVVVDKNDGNYFILPINGKIVESPVGYQTFNDQIGDSKSSEKLKSLRIPHRYDGLSVLDIGCNEGFFCIDALKRGASYVLGIDRDADIIKKARIRSNNIEYLNVDWWKIPDQKFDIIYLLSAIHYEVNQKELLDMILEHLTDTGKLILECGAISDESLKWYNIKRHDGYVKFPTLRLLKEYLLKNYCVTAMGRSVDQDGDPVSRYVFHCSIKKNSVMLVSGESGSGKSYLSSQLARNHNTADISLDNIIYSIKNNDIFLKDSRIIYQKIIKECDLNRIDKFINMLSENEQIDIADIFFDALPFEIDNLIIEGYPLSVPGIKNRLISRLNDKKIKFIWNVSKNV